MSYELYSQKNIDKLFKAVEDAGGNLVKDDYVLVVGRSAAIWLKVLSPVEIIVSEECPSDSVYLQPRVSTAVETPR